MNISFRIDWFDLLAVQVTLKSLLQHHSSKASVQHLAFLMIQLPHPSMAAEKTKALTIQTFVDKVMSPILNELSRFVRFSSRVQLSFNFMAAVTVCSDFGVQGNKICHCFHFSPFYLPWNDGTGCHDLKFFHFLPLQWYHWHIWDCYFSWQS